MTNIDTFRRGNVPNIVPLSNIGEMIKAERDENGVGVM
jgi:hypothetical protein